MFPPLTRHSVRLNTFWQGVLLALLVGLWFLNLADFLLTRHALWRGIAEETNWLMDYFFRQGMVPAVAFKIGVVTVGILVLWRLRKYPEALVAAALLTCFFSVVVIYQVTSLMAY